MKTTSDYLATLPTEELQRRHYQQLNMQFQVNEELERRGAIISKSETPIMKMIAERLNHQYKVGGKK